MKRLVFLLAAAALLLPACTHKSKDIKTETLTFKEVIPFHEGSKFNLDLDFDVDFPTAGFDEEALQFVRQKIRSLCFGDDFEFEEGSLDNLAQRIRNDYYEEYVEANQGLLEELGVSEEEAFNLNWECYIKGKFGEKYKDYVMYTADVYHYLGGAHGISAELPVVINLNDGMFVPYSHFTGDTDEATLRKLIDKHKLDNLELDEEFDPEHIFMVDPIEPSDSFTVGEEGITFYYQPYEIAPYVFGVITIPIPWEEIK